MANAPSYAEPEPKRAVVFIDGQNLYHGLREAFGYGYPNYDVLKLANLVCNANSWMLSEARFYTGYPDAKDDPMWHGFWSRKLLSIRRQGVSVFGRSLRYRDRSIRIKGGASLTLRIGEEKGIDVRIAIDLIRLAHRNRYDVAVVFSQDQDLSEVADEIRVISREQQRWIKMVSAFPVSGKATNLRGINHTDWIQVERNTYDQCIDDHDYRTPGEHP